MLASSDSQGKSGRQIILRAVQHLRYCFLLLERNSA